MRTLLLAVIAILVSVPLIVVLAAPTMDSTSVLLATVAILALVPFASLIWSLLRRFVRPRSLQWKLWSFMLLVGLLGSGLGIRARSASFRRLADYHARKAEDSHPPRIRGIRTDGLCVDMSPDPEPYCRRVSYHLAMAEKYQRAASYPWLPVSSDPPVPE